MHESPWMHLSIFQSFAGSGRGRYFRRPLLTVFSYFERILCKLPLDVLASAPL
jgi:hypothetical protein